MTGTLLGLYGAPMANIVRGQGAWLYDDEGHRYLDFLSGIAVTSLGHAHPVVQEALVGQLGRVWHTSNFFTTPPGLEAAAKIGEIAPFEDAGVFFCNSGAEAIEAALKLLRRARPDRPKVVVLSNSFHGRTFGALSATMQPGKRIPFEPLLPGFLEVALNDVAGLEEALADPEAGAVLFEPILGEAGVYPLGDAFAEALIRAQQEDGILLVADEIQTGMCRTGEWLASSHYGIVPDLFTLAKALGNGIPIGALVTKPEVGAAFLPGDHGSTFGGNPIAATAAVAVIEFMQRSSMTERVRHLGDLALPLLKPLPGVTQVEGRGLMLGLQLSAPVAKEVVERAFAAGLILNAPKADRLRLLPPLIISEPELTQGCELLAGALGEVLG
ncbi:aminotransferase class III-fold pyridoxal phosphate-dependent enzyme [Ferrimicrobium sp.]|uniref:aspartate aminotransferase family protein n=1 Tax=Ferrimicrobium sp. TaxID=2926050 RepID=UPI002621DC4E|nr:aminotransferase class III-fold pyridoxal phosphate-dependent enzyme [Ferrimicrobium sp.]